MSAWGNGKVNRRRAQRVPRSLPRLLRVGVAALLGAATATCAESTSSVQYDGDNRPVRITSESPHVVEPSWVKSPPKQHGRAFFATGVVDCVGERAEETANARLDVEARRKLVERLNVALIAVLPAYLRSILTVENQPRAEGLLGDAVVSVLRMAESETAIVERWLYPWPDGKRCRGFALARLGLETIVQRLDETLRVGVMRLQSEFHDSRSTLRDLLRDWQVANAP